MPDPDDDEDAIRRRVRAASDAADMAAIAAVRLAAAETADDGTFNPNLQPEDIENILDHLEETHGQYAITALTATLARWTALGFAYWAKDQDRTLTGFIDEWEMRLLAANLDDGDEDQDQDGAD